jgi:lambda repressor-like predicted transcriptional regulator
VKHRSATFPAPNLHVFAVVTVGLRPNAYNPGTHMGPPCSYRQGGNPDVTNTITHTLGVPDFDQSVVTGAAVPRLCAGCGVPLSRYNRQPVCGACSRSTRVLDASEIAANSPGLRVRAARRRRGWSLSMLASRAGFSVSYLSHIENGQRQLSSLRTIRAIATALGVPPVQLVPWLGTEGSSTGGACPLCGAAGGAPSNSARASGAVMGS